MIKRSEIWCSAKAYSGREKHLNQVLYEIKPTKSWLYQNSYCTLIVFVLFKRLVLKKNLPENTVMV